MSINDNPNFKETLDEIQQHLLSLTPEQLKAEFDAHQDGDIATWIEDMDTFSESPEFQEYWEEESLKQNGYKLIADEEELKWFFDNIMPPLQNDEVYFLSLSARSKLLSDEQKEKLNLGRTEMFERRIVREREWSRFLRTIKKFETAYGSYTTKNGSAIPNKAVVVYYNINPSNVIKAYNEFSQIVNDYMFEIAMCAMGHRDTTDIMHRIKKQDVLLMNCYQKNKGTKHWLDFDFDVPKNEITLGVVEEFVSEVRQHEGRAYIIETQGGYHVLVSKDTEFDKNFNPGNIADNYYRQMRMHVPIEDAKIEIIHNSNQMIPLPGTFHYDTVVRVLNKGE